MTTKRSYLSRLLFLTGSMFLLLTCIPAYGQGEVQIRNTAKEIKPGVYECIVYLDMSGDLVRTIDDVTYTLPPGYPRRKQKGRKNRTGVRGFFSSSPFITTEEAVVNVKIDYKGRKDLYRSYKLRLFNAAPE